MSRSTILNHREVADACSEYVHKHRPGVIGEDGKSHVRFFVVSDNTEIQATVFSGHMEQSRSQEAGATAPAS